MTAEFDLIKSSQNGNREDFGKIYDIYFAKIYRFVYYRTSHKETAEDLTSDIFIKAFAALKTFDPEKGSFAAWIFRIARNKIIDFYRTKKTNQDISGLQLKSGENLAENFDAKNSLQKVLKKLDSLTEEQKEIVVMRIWDDLPYKEISDILGRTEPSCRVLFCRAAAKLKDLK